jgi:copper chaperone CopZ
MPDGALGVDSEAEEDDGLIMQPSTDAISKLAYQFYLEDGKPEGFAEEHWARAEAFLLHPENHAEVNVLAPPSEPELTRALDEKAQELDTNLPSDPHTDENAVHQTVELAIDHDKKRQDLQTLQASLGHLQGIEGVEIDTNLGRVKIHFDARRTNPAAIHEAMLEDGYRASDMPQN